MNLNYLFYFVLILTALVGIIYAIVVINEPEEYKHHFIYTQAQDHRGPSLFGEERNELRRIHFEIHKQEDLEEDFLRKHTKHWRGKAHNIKYEGYDERVFVGKDLYLDNNKVFKEEFLDD